MEKINKAHDNLHWLAINWKIKGINRKIKGKNMPCKITFCQVKGSDQVRVGETETMIFDEDLPEQIANNIDAYKRVCHKNV